MKINEIFSFYFSATEPYHPSQQYICEHPGCLADKKWAGNNFFLDPPKKQSFFVVHIKQYILF
jgi:hypothetical protein